MEEGRIPSDWVGADVRLELVATEHYSIVTRLQGMDRLGIVALVIIDVPVAEGRTSPMDNPTREKLVPKFFPWHSVHAIRALEAEEPPLPDM